MWETYIVIAKYASQSHMLVSLVSHAITQPIEYVDVYLINWCPAFPIVFNLEELQDNFKVIVINPCLQEFWSQCHSLN